MFAVNLQVAVFFNNIVSRPDQLGNRMNAQMGNLFDAIPNTINLPPDVPDEIPLMQMSSTTSGNRLNVSRGRIDLFTSADPLEQVNLNRFIEMQEALVFSYFQALQNEKVVCNRLGLILTAFEESASAIEEIGKKYLTEMHMLAPEKSHLPLFMNRNGQKLTRAGVTYILNKYAKAASVIDPSVPEKIPPHLMRHTKAMHIYDADNDLVHVRDFLGHSDIKTTDIYARSSLTMKQKALERVSDSPVPSMPSWQKSRSTMEWLKSFGSQKA